MDQTAEVLIVEDDADWLEIYLHELASPEYTITKASTVQSAAQLLDRHTFSVVATDLKLLGANTGGFDILEMVRQRSPDTQVIIFTGYGGKQDAFEAMRRGAYDYVTKPLDYEHVRQVIKSAIKVRAQKLLYRQTSTTEKDVELPFPEKFVGSSHAIKKVLRQVADVAETDEPLLIIGDTGTGKALISETIHLASRRNRFVLVNCSSYSETTLERTLFGFVEGAFPEAVDDAPGLFEQATGGTLVLDRINGLSLRLQNRLLATLEQQQITRVGDTEPIEIDVRLIANSVEELNEKVDEGLFLEELYDYFANTTIYLPPLKNRKDRQTDDILLIAGYFLDKYAQAGKPPTTISSSARELLQSYDYPGNVRELDEVIRAAMAKAQEEVIEPEHLPERVRYQLGPVNGATNWKSRSSLAVPITCPHGHPLTERAEAIAHEFDTEHYVYVSAYGGTPAWFQITLEETLLQFGLKMYNPLIAWNNQYCTICRPIISSSLTILELSSQNHINYYKLGLIQALNIPYLLLARDGAGEDISFAASKVHTYTDEGSLRKVVLAWIERLSAHEH